tara:strand:- start:2430 stop:2621 length:192 start_codon:yes stop_codon:yes gene_type:complete
VGSAYNHFDLAVRRIEEICKLYMNSIEGKSEIQKLKIDSYTEEVTYDWFITINILEESKGILK